MLLGTGAATILLCMLAVGVLGGGLAASLTSSTPTATVEAQPPTVAAATATPEPLPLTDDFSNPASGFGVVQAEDGRVEYADGALRITSLAGGLEWFSPYAGINEQDLLIEVQAQRTEGPILSEMAVLCRWQDEANYIAAAWRGDGQVSLWKKTSGVEDRWLE